MTAITSKLVPLRDRILCYPMEPETQTAGGIIIPENARKQTGEYVVIAKGKGTEDDQMDDIEVGMHILLARYTGADVTFEDYDGNDHHGVIVKPQDVMGIVKT